MDIIDRNHFVAHNSRNSQISDTLPANQHFHSRTYEPSAENASASDLRWLGFSYIAFRLIHVLRDRQLGRLPELSLPEFATYVVFFPSLSAGPIDRAERFAQDLRKEFALTQDETLLAGQRARHWIVQKIRDCRYSGIDCPQRRAGHASPHHRLDVDHSIRLHVSNLL